MLKWVRKPTIEHVLKFVFFLKLNKNDLCVTWSNDKVFYDIENKDLVERVLKVLQEKNKIKWSQNL